MTTITRQQLRDAIEAGITAAERVDRGFRSEHAEGLRKVGAEATVTVRGRFGSHGLALCPVASAFPDDYLTFAWMTGGGFTTEYDVTMGSYGVPLGIAYVADDNSTEGEGA